MSQSTLTVPDDEARVLDIVTTSRRRNPTLAVTGALMFTETHFAQILEGQPAAIDELMASIRRDDRHKDIRVIEDQHVLARRFATWAMAYCGPLLLVEEYIDPFLRAYRECGLQDAAERLVAVMERLVT